jgi:hypothetical protein
MAMSGAMREKLAADFDLERFVDLFDQALTSDDPRVKNALRQLMMMVVLTDTDDHEGKQRASHGPLRRMQQDMRDQFRWIQRLENELDSLKKQMAYNETQIKVQSESGFKAQGVSPSEYWQKAIAQTNMLKPQGLENISNNALQGLNIKVAADTGEK